MTDQQIREAAEAHADKAFGVIQDEHRDSDRDTVDWIEAKTHFSKGCEYARKEAYNQALEDVYELFKRGLINHESLQKLRK